MGAFDSLEDPFSEVGELAEDLGLADSEDLDAASSALQAMLAEKGVPPETYRFLSGEPRAGTVPTLSLDTEDLVTQAGHMLDNLCGGPGLGKVGAAIVNRELLTGEVPEHEQPLWLVKDFRCEEGLSRLFRLDLTLKRPLYPETPAETAYAVDELGKALQFDKSNTGDGTYGISSTATDVAEAVQGVKDFAHKAMNPDDHLGEFSDAQDPDALDLKRFVPGDNPVDPAEFLEQPCRLSVARRWPGDHFTLSERWFSGVCVELEDLGNAEPGQRVIRLVVAPRLWRLSQRASCRVFQNLNAVQIVLAILKEHGIYQDPEDAGEERVTSCLRLEPGGADLVGPVGVPDELAAMADKVVGAIPGADGAMDFLKKSVEDWTPPREHCVQYDETDLEFVERLLAEEGITYSFEHSERRETLVLADDPKLAGKRTMTLDRRSLQARDGEPSSSELQKAELGWDFHVDRVLVPSAVTLRDFSLSHPTSVTEVQAGEQALKIAGGAGLETMATQAVGLVTEAGEAKGTEDYAGPEAKVFEYPAELTLEYDETPEKAAYETYDGPPLAQHALERFRSRGAAATLSSTVTLATPANTITVRNGGFDILQDGVRGDVPSTGGRGVVGVKQKVLITEVVHRSSGGGYRNVIRCLNAEVRYRPPSRSRRPVISGVQSATVIDTAWSDGGEKPITGVSSDDLDRALVRFHWDRRARDTGDAEKAAHSCWVRVAQRFGGEGHGAVLVPRVGMEALVSFLEGNPDRPVIVGCLYNADRSGPSTYAPQPDRTDLPFSEPPRKPVTIVRSRSWPQTTRERGNELVFNDTGAHEEVTLFAQRDLEEKVGQDHVTTVLLDQTNRVGRDQLEKAAADQTLWVNHVSESAEAPGRKKTVKGEYEKTTIGTPAAKAPLDEVVHGSSTVTIGGTRKETVGEDETLLVEGGAAAAGGSAEGGEPPKARSVTVRGSQKVAITQNDLLHVSGDCMVAAQGAYTITAQSVSLSTSAGGDPTAADPESGLSVTDGAVKMASKGGVALEGGEALEITSDTNAVLVTAPRKIVLQCGTDLVVLDGVAGTITIQSQAGVRLGTPSSFIELQPRQLVLNKGSDVIVARAEEGTDATAELQHPAMVTLDFDGEIHFNGADVGFQRG